MFCLLLDQSFQIKNHYHKSLLSKNNPSKSPINTRFKRILAAVDACLSSIRALDYASHDFQDDSTIYVIHITEWPDDYEQSID